MAKYGGKDFLIQRGYLVGAAWVLSTAYTLGQIVSNGGNVYVCITAGTSASSGGPTTTADDITDGSVHWSYISAVSGSYGYKTIGGLRSNSLTMNNEEVDVTDKGDVPWKQLLAVGIRSMAVSGSGMFSNDRIATQIMADAVAGTFVTLKLISGRGDSFVGSFLISSCERNGEYNGAEQYSLSFSSAAAITYTAPT